MVAPGICGMPSGRFSAVAIADAKSSTPMRDFLQKISPLTNATRIVKPLFVVQGKNDPRVPYSEAEQIVAKARENKTPVWYLRAENEGHGFARKENADYEFYATVLFVRQNLLK